MPHYIFAIPFADLVKGKDPQPGKTGYRLINPSNKDQLLIYDFDNDKSNSLLQQVVNDSEYAEQV